MPDSIPFSVLDLSPIVEGGSAAQAFRNSLDLAQLSKWTSNATLYYETDTWGARVSSAYRDGYLDGVGGNGNVGSGYHSTNNIDFAAHYNAPGGLKLVFEGINLNGEDTVQYRRKKSMFIWGYENEPRYAFGARYRFN